MRWFSNLFKCKKLEQEVIQLRQALNECNNKILEKQEVINKTNAYWKNKLREAKSFKKSNKKEL